MARYAKPRKTELRGLRTHQGSRPESFSPNEIEKMGEKVGRVLTNCHKPLEKDMFLLDQVILVCLFRQAKNDFPKRDKLFRKINKGEEKGHWLGFTTDELNALNRWVLGQDLVGKLNELLQRVEMKRKEAKLC